MLDAFGLSQYSGEGAVEDVEAAGAPLDEPVSGPVTRIASTSVWAVEVVTTYQEFLNLKPIWDALVAQANSDHPFIGHEWARAWWDAFGAGQKLNVLLVRANGHPVAIVPLMSSRRWVCGIPVRQLQFIWNVFVERCDFIVGPWPRAAYRAALTHLLNHSKEWDLLLLHQLPENSPTIAEFRRLGSGQGIRVETRKSAASPYLPINGTWQDYQTRLHAKHRSNLRNRHKRLERLGSVALEVITSSEAVAQALEDGFRLETAAWKGRAGSAIGSCPQRRHYYTQLAQAAAQRGVLRLCFLTLDGIRIAFGYFIEQGNKMYLLKPGYDPSYAAYSPSNLLCDLVLRDAFDRQVSEVDFLGLDDPWKLQWTKQLRLHYWLYAFPDRPKSRFVHLLRFRLQPALGRMQFLKTLCRTALVILTNACRCKVAAETCVRDR